MIELKLKRLYKMSVTFQFHLVNRQPDKHEGLQVPVPNKAKLIKQELNRGYSVNNAIEVCLPR